MLNEQFRMEEEIADIANLYYGNYENLISNDDLESRINQRNVFYSWFPGNKDDKSVEIVDTSNLNAWVTSIPQGSKHSRLNCFSAALCVEMAFKYAVEYVKKKMSNNTGRTDAPIVLIVAPYRPHVDRIKKLIDFGYEHYGIPKDAGLVKAGTIHSFQGNEADIVIFDLVIDEPHWKAGIFMPDEEINANMRKLFNVAITRAKFKLFVVGNIDYCRKKAKNNALGELLNYLTSRGFKTCDAKQLFPKLAVSLPSSFTGRLIDKDEYLVCREGEFYNYLLGDIKAFKTRMVIFSPFITSNRLAELLPEFQDAINQGKQIVVITKALSDRAKKELAQYQKYEEKLTKIGVKVIHKKGMHEKIILVDDDAVWVGSLNALSFSGLTGEIMIKHCDANLTAETEELYDISHIQEALDNAEELVCPICNEPMELAEGNTGGLYWKCTGCGFSRNMNQPYPTDGVLRCKDCGSTYHFVMKNEPRWVCDADSRHYRKMRYNDLNLEKMAALIPTKKDREMVEEYFNKGGTKITIKNEKTNTVKEKTVSNKKATVQRNIDDSEDYVQLSIFDEIYQY